MSEEKAVLKKFELEIRQLLDEIDAEMKMNNEGNALVRLNELLVMKRMWQEEYKKPGHVLVANPWTGPNAIYTGSTKNLAYHRITYLDAALNWVKPRWEKKGWRFPEA